MDSMTTEIPAFVCAHVFEKRSAVLFVCRAEGDWQMLCGGPHEGDEVPRVIGLNHLVEDDRSLREILDLPPDWEAERSEQGSKWDRRPIT